MLEQRIWSISRQVWCFQSDEETRKLKVLKRVKSCVLACGIWAKQERKREVKRRTDKLGEDERFKRLEVLMCP